MSSGQVNVGVHSSETWLGRRAEAANEFQKEAHEVGRKLEVCDLAIVEDGQFSGREVTG